MFGEPESFMSIESLCKVVFYFAISSYNFVEIYYDSRDLRDNCFLRPGLYSSGFFIDNRLFRPEPEREDTELIVFLIGEIGLGGSLYFIGTTPVVALSCLAGF